MPQTWIFQGNPNAFDIDGYLAAGLDRITWGMRQRSAEVREGDRAYIWRAAGAQKADSGIIASATVIGALWVGPDHPEAEPFQRGPTTGEVGPRVWLRVDRVARKKEVIKSEWLREDPVCSDLPILKQPAGTNWILDEAHRERLDRLWSRTAVDWDRADCVAALWAYDVTYPGPISKLRGSPVANVAQQIGRAVGGVYNKLLNFRHIDDPRDARAGLSGGSHVDQEVWDEFWDATAGQLRSEALEQAYLELWGAPPPGVGTAKLPPSDPPGSLPTPPSLPPPPPPLPPPPPPGLAPGRGTSTVSRIIRDTRVTAWVKQAHDFTCQVCGIRLVGRDGPYAEGAHIQPLGAEHRGPDRVENVLCLCSNHHVLLDMGAYAIQDDGELVDLLGAEVSGRLRMVAEHKIGVEYLAYHRLNIARRLP